MSTVRAGAPGATRICPHCRQTILESAVVCPACKHHLRAGTSRADARAAKTTTALRVEGVLEHDASNTAWEYSVVVAVANERGEEIGRHVINVGALNAGQKRTFTLNVDVFKPG